MSQLSTHITGYRFDEFLIDIRNRQLWRGDALLPLNSKYFDVLVLLVTHSGQLIEKRRIFEEIWDGVYVTDAALTQCVKSIRKQLGDEVANPRYIKTVPKHGYVFIGKAVEVHEEPVAPPVAPKAVTLRPYKFLDYYTEHDAAMFFGREPEIDAVCSQILARRSFILHGRSGVGKSSMLRAGVMPHLLKHGHLVFAVRSFTDPLSQMKAALMDVLEMPAADEGIPSVSSLQALVERIRELPAGRFVVVLFDQFEEFFTLLDEAQRKPFIEAVGQLAADPGLPVRFVFVLREDVLAEMSQFKPAIPEIFHHEYRLQRLAREQAARAITEPAQAVGCRYEPELVFRLLDDLSDHDTVDPPHLQIVCDTLYDARDEEDRITLEAYERLGAAPHILTEYLTRVLRRFNTADLTIVQQILLALISADGQRLVLRVSELEDRIKLNSHASRFPVLIEELVAARIIRRRSQDGDSWAELAHECLIPEVSRWLTSNAYAVKQARELMERTLENYRSHRLIPDADTLDLLTPFLDQLGVTGEEADLLTMSLLHRGRPVPEWLVRLTPSSSTLIIEATRHEDARVRLHAVESSRPVRGPALNHRLRTLALWDDDLGVRKAASIELADWLGTAVETALGRTMDGRRAGRIRRAISLAIVREHNNRLIQLPHLSFAVSVMVMMGLVLVRLRRNGMDIIRQGVGGTFGGAASGLLGGLLLGAGLTIARRPVAFEATSLLFVLCSLGTFIGAFGGGAVSFGKITIEQIAYRHSRWWSALGGAAGGAFIGGTVNLLSVDTLKTLFGHELTGLTGAVEGAVIGAGVTIVPVLLERFFKNVRAWHHILGGALGGICAGVFLTVLGGNLFSSSLEIVRQSFADSQIRLEPIATFFGEGHFGQTTKIALGALEGFLFGCGMTAGIEVFAQSEEKDE